MDMKIYMNLNMERATDIDMDKDIQTFRCQMTDVGKKYIRNDIGLRCLQYNNRGYDIRQSRISYGVSPCCLYIGPEFVSTVTRTRNVVLRDEVVPDQQRDAVVVFWA
jgi:hypothetical protein